MEYVEVIEKYGLAIALLVILIILLMGYLLAYIGRRGERDHDDQKIGRAILAVAILVAVFGLCYFLLFDPNCNHKWSAATCTQPKTCLSCNATEGSKEDHTWKAASCTDPKTCVVCNATEGSKEDHTWKAASCTDPKTCVVCNATEGTVEHQWIEATYAAPKTCALCNKTTGEKLKAEEVYINELIYQDTDCDHYGKIWTMGVQKPSYTVHTDVTSAADYMDINTRGHTAGVVYDLWGNQYTYGFHVDGPNSHDYYIILDIQGKYTRFSGICSMTPDLVNETGVNYFEVWGDGRRLYSSKEIEMGKNIGHAEPFDFDVTGVHELKIIYPASKYKNRIAAIFDGKLS